MSLPNTIIPQIPSKAHNIYIMSLFEKDNTIFTTNRPGISYGSTVNAKSTRRYPAYVWDLYDLSARISKNTINSNNFYQMSATSTDPYRLLYVKKFSDNSGENVYNKLPSFIPLALNNTPSFSAYKYSCDFSFSPLINTVISTSAQDIIATSNYESIQQLISDQLAGETAIYLASKIPMFPLFVCSTVNSHYSFGPIFANRINISVSGENDLGQVSIACNFIGGRSLVSPDKYLLNIKKPSLEPIVDNSINKLDNSGPHNEAAYFYDSGGGLVYNPYDYYKYRSASLVDVFVVKEYISSYADVLAYKSLLNASPLPPTEKIVGVSLDISQEIDLEYTYPEILLNNTYKYMGDKFGPRYAILRSRKVSGSITYYGHKLVENYPNNTSGLTLYFGGPFYYAMKNVDWSPPSIDITPNGGYKYTYNFTARLPSLNEEVTFFTNNLNQNVSEFSYSSYIFNIQDLLDNLGRLLSL